MHYYFFDGANFNCINFDPPMEEQDEADTGSSLTPHSKSTILTLFY